MIASLKFMAAGAIIAVDPNNGRGITESIISVLIVLAFIASLFVPIDPTQRGILNGILGIVVGAYFTSKGIDYNSRIKQ